MRHRYREPDLRAYTLFSLDAFLEAAGIRRKEGKKAGNFSKGRCIFYFRLEFTLGLLSKVRNPSSSTVSSLSRWRRIYTACSMT